MTEWQPEKMVNQSTLVPEGLRAALTRYVEQGIEPGNGLRAVLENRPLSQIIGSVDRETETALGSIYRFLYNYLGGNAWGSPERVEAWLDQKGMAGE